MSGEETERPVMQVVGDQDAAYCDPSSGVCELPAASETPGPRSSHPRRPQ